MRPLIAAPRETSVARGIGLALAGYGCFSTSDAIIKTIGGSIPVCEVALFIALFAFGPIACLAAGQGGWRAMVPRRPGLVVLRALLSACCALLAWGAFTLMPLTDGYAILFASPILIIGLSVLVLREAVGWRRWLAAGVGFCGVLVMINPRFADLGWGHLLASIATVVGSCSFIVLRKIGPRETSASILAVLFAAIGLAALPGALAGFVRPAPGQLVMLALAGLLQGGGQAVMVMANRETPTAVVAPLQYTQMLWAVAFGVLLFHDRPTPTLLAGMALVVGAGLYSLWREAVRQRPAGVGLARGEVPARQAR